MWRGRLCTLIVAVLVVVLGPAPGSVAVEGATDPQSAPPLWCSPDSSISATAGTQYALAWIPAGATATFTAEDIQILPSRYVGNGRGEYIYTVTLLNADSGSTVWSDWNFTGVGIVWGGGPYDWVSVGSKRIGSWTNRTGVAQSLLVKTDAHRSYAGAGTRYNLKVDVTGGDGAPTPACDDAWIRASLGPQPDNGAAADPVNTGNGNFYDTVVDVPRVGALGDALLQRTYNSMDPGMVVDPATGRPGLFGRGWTSWLDTSLTRIGTDTLTYREATGRQVDITRSTSGTWTVPADLDATLQETADGRRLAFHDGRSVTFDEAGRIAAADADTGETVEVVRDAGTGVPTRAVFRWHGAVSATTTFTDTTGDGLIDAVEGPGGIRRTYTYDNSGRLTSVSVPHLAGQAAPAADTYVWDSAGRIERILTEVGTGSAPIVRVANTYDDNGRVATQRLADGDTTTFEYGPLDENKQRLTTVTHSGGGSSETYHYLHNSTGQLLSVTDPSGRNVETTWQGRQLATATTRAGAKITYAYDAATRLTQVALPDPAAPETSDRSEHVTYCDASGADTRVRSVTDAGGTVTTYAYGSSPDPGYPCAGKEGTPSSVTQAAGTAAAATTLIEWTDGVPMKATDPDGVVTRFRWDTAHRLLLAREQDPATKKPEVTFFGYDDAGRLRVTRSPLGIETWYAHDPAGDVTAVTGPMQAPSRDCTALEDTCSFPDKPAADAPTQTLTYRLDGSVASYTDQTGSTWTYTRDELGNGGRRETESAPDGSVRTLDFDTAGRLTSETTGDPEKPAVQATTSYTYGALGRLTSVTDPTGVKTRYDYDAEGNPTKVLDKNGNGNTTVFDALGRPTKQTDALGHTQTFEYGPTGLLTRSVDRTGAASTYTYDPLGRLLTATDARGGVTKRTYTSAGRLAKETDATNRTTSFAYDGAGRLISVSSPSGAKTVRGYDTDGRLVAETSPEGRTTTLAYDAAGQVLSIDDPRSGLTRWSYNARGDMKSRTDATGDTVTWKHDPLGRVSAVTDPLGRVMAYSYDGRGNRISRTDAKGGVRSWRYDLADRVVAEVDPLDRKTAFDYDDLGELKKRVDSAGRTQTYGYDDAGQMTSIEYGDGSTTTFGYDPEGRRTRMVDATGTTGWSYDAAGNLTSADNSGDRDLQWAWDLAGRRTVMTYPDGTRYRNTYDADGNLASVQRDNAGTWVDVAADTWDADGNLLSQTQPDGHSRSWTLDPKTGLPTAYTETGDRGNGAPGNNAPGQRPATGPGQGQGGPGGPGGNAATTTAFTHDAAGRITSETTGKATTTYGYDAAGQLVAVDRSAGPDDSYDYDRLGRRTASMSGSVTTTYTWDPTSELNRRTVDGVAHDYAYDPSGRRTSETWDSGASSREWTWDARGALTGERNSSPHGVTETTRTVRGDGRLDGVRTTAGGTTETTGIVWDDTLPVPQPVWSGARGQDNETRAVYGPDLVRVDCPARVGCTGSIAHDAHGSAVETAATNKVVQARSYGAWGEGTAQPTGPSYGYGGELHVGSLTHLRARDYDPTTGTFLSPDPLDGVDGTTTVANPYHYANNDPTNQNDPTGLRPGENDCATALVRIVCEHQQQIIDVTATVAAGLVCGALAAPAGPFAAGAAASVCGGAVHRALSASYQGDNPWSAALNPEAVVDDAVVGGLTGAVAAKVFAWASPLLSKAAGRLAPRLGPVLNPRPGYTAGNTGKAIERWSWPPNRGFLHDPVPTTLKPGTRIDRYGREGGTYVSPEGTPFAQRALPPKQPNTPYRVYEVVAELEVRGGITAPWFGQPGGGIQYELPGSVGDLISRGILKSVG